MNIRLRFVFYREDDYVIAHCLELDLVGHGATHKEAAIMLCDAIAIQVEDAFENGSVETIFRPAPGKYFQMFASGKSSERIGKALAKLELRTKNLDVPEFEGRESEDMDLVGVCG